MKFILLFFFSSFVVLGQDLEVAYHATYIGTSLEDAKELAREHDMSANQLKGFLYYIRKVKSDIENQEIVLRTSGSNQFSLELPASLDLDFDGSVNLAPTSLGLFNNLYCHDSFQVIGFDDSKEFAVIFDFSDVIWTVTEESKSINGFKCFKATIEYKESLQGQFARDHVEVWFTPEINKRGGPIVYANLPGLILEVKLKNALITVSSIKTIDSHTIEETLKPLITEMEMHKQAMLTGKAIEDRMKK